MSLAYHLETDDKIEVVNRCLEQYLRSYVHDNPKTGENFFYGQNGTITWLSIRQRDFLISKLFMADHHLTYNAT